MRNRVQIGNNLADLKPDNLLFHADGSLAWGVSDEYLYLQGSHIFTEKVYLHADTPSFLKKKSNSIPSAE